jgi:hypothetical protein
MDPNTLLTEIRELATDIENSDDDHFAAQQLANKIQDLDAWLCNQGFLPKDWER